MKLNSKQLETVRAALRTSIAVSEKSVADLRAANMQTSAERRERALAEERALLVLIDRSLEG